VGNQVLEKPVQSISKKVSNLNVLTRNNETTQKLQSDFTPLRQHFSGLSSQMVKIDGRIAGFAVTKMLSSAV
jgi:hypothetical protein